MDIKIGPNNYRFEYDDVLILITEDTLVIKTKDYSLVKELK